MKKKSVVLLVIGIILLIIPFIFSTYNLIRLIVLAIGIFLITLSFIFHENKNIYLVILTPIILIFLSYAIDTFLFYKFNRIPLFVYELKSSKSVSTYNSLFYRIYECDDDLILDYGYKKNYVCNENDLKVIDINTFLNDSNKTYQEYKGKFVKITGKISKLSGAESIELSSYKESTDSLNGYVSFNNNYILRIFVNENLNNYRIYDDITIIGRVESIIDENGISIINLVDAKLIPNNTYKTFTYEIVNSNDKNLLSLVSEQNYYLYGISNLNVRYANNTIYELSYLITDDRITLDDIIGNYSATNFYDESRNLVAKGYELEKFNVLVCENDRKIIANKNFELNSNLCLN